MVDILNGRLTDPRITSDPTEGPIVTEPFTDMLQLLRDVRSELRKTHPSIMTLPIIEPFNGGGAIIDTNVHRVRFKVAGEFVPIYKLMMFSTYANPIAYSFIPLYQPGVNGGFQIAANTLIQIDNVELWELYISVGTLVNNQLVVNAASGSDNNLDILGWTSDEWAIAYQPDRR